MKKYIDLLETVPCNLCGSEDCDTVYPPRYEDARPDEISQSFRSSGDEVLIDRLVRCRKCGLLYLNPRLRQDLILEGYSSGTDETFISQIAGRERTFSKSLDLIERLAPQKGRILDIGTAGGSFLGVAARRGWNVYGCEPSRWLAEWGRKHYNIAIHPGTVFDMDLEEGSFDVVTFWDVLEHTPDPVAVLKKCHSLLRPDGLLVVNYPDINSSISRLMGRRWVFLLSVHLYYFTGHTIADVLKKSGFNVVLQKRHWQILELGYIFYRMNPYIPGLGNILSKAIKAIGMESVQIPYWMGQMLVIARCSK
jgi:2-polyprenyl-3-methyl-5-hydroxy-6-metoxy-1,4-benzoquinol methylase